MTDTIEVFTKWIAAAEPGQSRKVELIGGPVHLVRGMGGTYGRAMFLTVQEAAAFILAGEPGSRWHSTSSW